MSRGPELSRAIWVIDDDAEVGDLLGEPCGALGLGGSGDGRGDQDRGDPGGGHGLGLGQLGAADPDRAGPDLAMGDGGGLVGLGMGAKRQTRSFGPRGHLHHVAIEGVEVEDGGGGRDQRAGARLADQAGVGGAAGHQAPMNPGSQPSWAVRSLARGRSKTPFIERLSPPEPPIAAVGTPAARAAARIGVGSETQITYRP